MTLIHPDVIFCSYVTMRIVLALFSKCHGWHRYFVYFVIFECTLKSLTVRTFTKSCSYNVLLTYVHNHTYKWLILPQLFLKLKSIYSLFRKFYHPLLTLNLSFRPLLFPVFSDCLNTHCTYSPSSIVTIIL